jgi:hypothetical protein
MTDGELQRIVDRVYAALPKGVLVPRPEVIAGPGEIPAVQRKAGVHEFRHGAVICLPMLDLVYIFRTRLERDFADDKNAIADAVRRALVETVAPGFTGA